MTELVTLLLGITFSPVSIFLIVVPLLISTWMFRRSYRKTGLVESRYMYAARTLAMGQLIMVGAFAAIFVLSAGFILFAAAGIVFANVIAAIAQFGIPLLTYPWIRRWATRPTSTATVGQTSYPAAAHGEVGIAIYVVIGIAIPIAMFTMLNGRGVWDQVVASFAVATGNVGLVESQPYEFERTHLYAEIAKNEQSTDVCDNIDDALTRFHCYTAADPEFETRYAKTCERYTKAGESEYVDYWQRDCLTDRIYSQLRSTQPQDAIDCDAIAREYSRNIQISFIVLECRQIALIQKAVREKDPSICDQILGMPKSTQYDHVAIKHAACIVHFHGSPVWKSGCDTYKDNDYFGINYTHLASCDSPTVVAPTGASEEKYWFRPR